jgi:hypothetical protein
VEQDPERIVADSEAGTIRLSPFAAEGGTAGVVDLVGSDSTWKQISDLRLDH